MPDFKYTGQDDLGYYNSKLKNYLNIKLENCLNFGGNYQFEELPLPSSSNLNYIYKITNEFISNEFFEKPNIQYHANIYVKVIKIESLNSITYLYRADDNLENIYIQLDNIEDTLVWKNF